jgi:hypothetical protein
MRARHSPLERMSPPTKEEKATLTRLRRTPFVGKWLERLHPRDQRGRFEKKAQQLENRAADLDWYYARDPSKAKRDKMAKRAEDLRNLAGRYRSAAKNLDKLLPDAELKRELGLLITNQAVEPTRHKELRAEYERRHPKRY